MKEIIAMIPAAGRGSRMLSLTEDNPKALLPLFNKTIIDLHLDKLISEGIKNVCIIVGYKKEKLIDHVNKLYKNKINVIYAEQKELKGLAHAIYFGLDELSKNYNLLNYNLLIVLGDTIFNDKLILNDKSWIGYSIVKDYSRWCLMNTIDFNDKLIINSFIDKPEDRPYTNKAVIGIYYFTNIIKLQLSIANIIINDIKIKNEFQLSSAMEIYKEQNLLYAIEFKDWYDCGEVDTFINSKKNLTRFFNSIKITEDNTVIKKSNNIEKIQDEINWYKNIPRKLLIYTPHLISYNKDNYELEYINFNPIQELYLYNLPGIDDWEIIFQQTFKMINKFKDESKNEEDKNFIINNNIYMLKQKLNSRINKYNKIKILLNQDLIINNIKYQSFHKLKDILNNKLSDMCLDTNFWQIIHGDLFFGNMFFDINSKTLKVIDPRGSYGDSSIYGDIRYDLAKLNHSIKGKYDFIVNNLYSFEKIDFDNGVFNFIIYDNTHHVDIINLFNKYLTINKFDINNINIITGCLFLSMIPLHEDNFNNQLMMYLTGIKLLNEYL